MNSKLLVGVTGCRYQIARLIHVGSISCANRANPVIDSIIRVDHAGELGADRIYAGQMAVLGNSKMGPVIQHMWDQEKVHKETFEKLIVKYRARPTVMVPIWNVAGFLLGAGTALMGEKAAMACTVAVESVIVDHYNDQLRTLMDEPEKNKELLETIQKFRDEEQEHHDSGLDHGAEQAPFYRGLTEVIKFGCKTAIAISKDLFSNRLQHAGCRSYSTSAQTEPINKSSSWDLITCVCLERKPIITKPLNECEAKFMKLFSDIEYERSSKSDHEINKEDELKRIKNMSSSMNITQAELDLLSRQTLQEFEDKCTAEYEQFQVAPRTSDEDMKSKNRQLDCNLYFLVKLGGVWKYDWAMPQGLWQEGETLRMTAERVLRENCGNIQATFMGNAPWGFHKYLYPKGWKEGKRGAKLFFYKAIYRSGDVTVNGIDYQWVTQAELMQFIKSRSYVKRVKMFLLDETDYIAENNV